MRLSAVGCIGTLVLGFLTPLTADAQTPAKIPHIGIIAEWPEDSSSYMAFRQG